MHKRVNHLFFHDHQADDDPLFPSPTCICWGSRTSLISTRSTWTPQGSVASSRLIKMINGKKCVFILDRLADHLMLDCAWFWFEFRENQLISQCSPVVHGLSYCLPLWQNFAKILKKILLSKIFSSNWDLPPWCRERCGVWWQQGVGWIGCNRRCCRSPPVGSTPGHTEMEKAADAAGMSVLFFSAGANF